MFLSPTQVKSQLLPLVAFVALAPGATGCGSARRIAEHSAGTVIAHEVDRKLDQRERRKAQEQREDARSKRAQDEGRRVTQPTEAP